MVLRIIADRREELPEPLRAGAVEKQGQWISDLQDHSVENATGLKEALVTERGARKKMEQQLKAFGWTLSEDGTRWINEGVDPSKAKDAIEKISSGTLKGSDEIERWKQSIESKLQEDKQRIEAGLVKLKDSLRRAKLEPIYSTVKELGGSVELLAPAIEKRAQIDFDDDFNASLAFLNEKGQPMLTRKSGSTDPMGIEEFVQDLRKHPTFRAAFAGMGPGGSGFTSQGGGSTRVVRAGSDVSLTSPRDLIHRANEYSTTGKPH